ncbi:MAG: hypothetical protein BWY10_02274 [Chloroflexi bacterium ADurb.Bin180]|nr:MAG: hypothetical protein BWY10_02274 [Chloroflexi bacterium ADurb.Bin180]
MKRSSGGQIQSVAPGSLWERAGLRSGDIVLAVNGHPLRDVIDFQFYSADYELSLVVRRSDGPERELRMERQFSDALGIEFTAPTFDGLRLCRNRCEFCFVQQMPKGLRQTLYLRDDDLRYSFLYGNFVTLTNWTEDDWQRVAEQRLSPLYVSVHATDCALRARLLGLTEVPDVLEQVERLGDMGIEVHAQLVVVPGLNDGAVLERSVEDLAKLYPTVQSVGVVPVGITRYQCRDIRTMTAPEAQTILAWAEPVRRRFLRRLGSRLVYPSDEIYLLAGSPVPGAATYGGYPQLNNGIGLTRLLRDDWSRLRRRLPAALAGLGSATLVCGKLIGPTLEELASQLASASGVDLRVLAVENAFFGPTVTVSGLLTWADVHAALAGQDVGRLLVLPGAMFDAAKERTLDDATLEEIRSSVGVPVLTADCLSELAAAWLRLGQEQEQAPR